MHPPSSSRCTGNENIVRTRLRCNVRNPRPEISAGRVSPFCGHRIVLCLFRDPSPEQPERFCTVRTRYRAAVALSLSLSPPSFSLFYFIALLRPRSVRRRERQKFSPIETIQRGAMPIRSPIVPSLISSFLFLRSCYVDTWQQAAEETDFRGSYLLLSPRTEITNR